MGSGGTVVGRDAELTTLTAALEGPERPVGVVLEGASGIGKSTLLAAAVDAARALGYRVLFARPAEAESRLPFAALGDLLDELPEEVMASLPDPQRRALEVALLQTDARESPSEQRIVSVAVLGALRSLARAEPLVIAVDDLQWLDGPTARVLAFALRRLETEQLIFLAVVRTEEGDRIPPVLARSILGANTQRLPLTPLSVDHVERMIRSRLGTGFPKPILTRLHRQSGGNPLYALELARTLDGADGHAISGQAFPVPETLRTLVRHRVGTAPAAAREALLVVAALAQPTREAVLSVLGPDRALGLQAAIDARLLEEEADLIRFTHPLLASEVLAEAGPVAVAHLHRELAAFATDPVEKARHLSLGTADPDPGVALTLDQAARLARDRGAPDAGAELAEEAIRLTPPLQIDDVRVRRVAAADLHLEAGDIDHARTLLELALVDAPPGRERAEVLRRLARIRHQQESYPAARELFEEALEESGEDLELRAQIRRGLAWSALMAGDLGQAAANARAALELAESLGDPLALSEALAAVGLADAMLGRGIKETHIRRSASLEERSRTRGVEPHLDSSVGLILKVVDDVEAARSDLESHYHRAQEQGDEGSQAFLLWHLSELESRAGRWELAEDYADDGLAAALRAGQEPVRGGVLYAKALVLAHRGQVDAARALAQEGMAVAERCGASLVVINNLSVLGFIELSVRDHAAADRYMRPLADLVLSNRLREPVLARFLPDEIESLAALGELDMARSLIERLDERGRALERVWALATAARCRALLAAAEGDLPAALEALAAALVQHDRLPYPFARGRTLLILGEVQRRVKQKRAARESLQQALNVFEELGATLWAERTRTEMGRIGGRPGGAGELTETERQVADLVSEGRSNREVAEVLFLAVKTVDSNLSRVFHKLQVRSRTELAVEWIRRRQAVQGGD